MKTHLCIGKQHWSGGFFDCFLFYLPTISHFQKKPVFASYFFYFDLWKITTHCKFHYARCFSPIMPLLMLLHDKYIIINRYISCLSEIFLKQRFHWNYFVFQVLYYNMQLSGTQTANTAIVLMRWLTSSCVLSHQMNSLPFPTSRTHWNPFYPILVSAFYYISISTFQIIELLPFYRVCAFVISKDGWMDGLVLFKSWKTKLWLNFMKKCNAQMFRWNTKKITMGYCIVSVF